MNELFMLPPLTASYSNNIGPRITLAYEEIARRSFDIKNLFIPWNSGGRKFERVMQGNYESLFLAIEECKKLYQSEGLLPVNFYESNELDKDFKNLVFKTFNSSYVQEKKLSIFYCANCNKKRLASINKVCKICGKKQEVLLEKSEVLFFDDKKINFIIKKLNIFPKHYNRLFCAKDNPYLIKVFREAEKSSHWFNSNGKTFNQRYVSIHWLSYAHKKYRPNKLNLFCGNTIEYKWLLPALCLLTFEELKKTNIYIHGFFKKSLYKNELNKFKNLNLLLSSSNIGTDIFIDQALLKRIQKIKIKLKNIQKFLIQHVHLSNKKYDLNTLLDIEESIHEEFRCCNNKNALDYFNKYLRILSRNFIEKIKKEGIILKDLNNLKNSIKNVTKYYN